MNRLIAVGVSSVALLVILTSAVSAADSPPNVLFIAVDDLNDWVGVLGGHPQAKTPAIDALAQSGTLFTHAYCQAPICNPSRISLMTGLLPSTTGIYLLSPTRFRITEVLKDQQQTPTIPEWFSQHGYRTTGVGKIFHANSSKETFDQYGKPAGSGPFPSEKLNGPPGTRLWDWGRFPDRDELQPDYQVASWAIDQLRNPQRLRSRPDQPFFLAVGFFRPHVPMYAPEKWWDLHGPEDQIQLPSVNANDLSDITQYARKLTWSRLAPRQEWIDKNQQHRRAVHSYLASVSFVDAQIGRVIAALRNSEFGNNTVIVLWSDHGFALGEKQRWAKRGLWERESRVPLIVSAPNITGNQVCDSPVGLIDIYPTLCELCGLPIPSHVEGRSFQPQLRDPTLPTSPALTTFHYNNHAVRSSRYRYIRYADGSEELYDHDNDPHEWRNLASSAEAAPIIERLRKSIPKVNAKPVPGSNGLGVRDEDVKLFGGYK